jgi:hypothetical protein
VNVEVEVVKEHRQTFLVMNVRSLEEAESIATDMAQSRGRLHTKVPKRWSRKPTYYATWSHPVIVRDGEIVREDSRG